MDNDILEDIGEVDETESDELEVYEDRNKEEAIKDTSKYVPKNKNGGRPKGSPNKKNKGPMGEELEDAPSGQDGVDDYEEAMRKEEEAAKQESMPKAEQSEEQLPIVVVKELPVQQVVQRIGIDENGRKVRLVTIEEALTTLFNK